MSLLPMYSIDNEGETHQYSSTSKAINQAFGDADVNFYHDYSVHNLVVIHKWSVLE